ncbi:hypothetical protein DUI87_30156 [Hirundo rustica rustica]|uniref:Ubiquitin-related modifier 1 n=1 Tax=Hirundo rustica rustica TaxID=333673 RepID=A0A3M0J3R1_HIRRU|nr:hypothetical protein DUI87_30156 [Hirundo rustica rustica]
MAAPVSLQVEFGRPGILVLINEADWELMPVELKAPTAYDASKEPQLQPTAGDKPIFSLFQIQPQQLESGSRHLCSWIVHFPTPLLHPDGAPQGLQLPEAPLTLMRVGAGCGIRIPHRGHHGEGCPALLVGSTEFLLRRT